jgi:hypothetical protein
LPPNPPEGGLKPTHINIYQSLAGINPPLGGQGGKKEEELGEVAKRRKVVKFCMVEYIWKRKL